MGISTSIFLIAIGAILDFAVNVQTSDVDLHTVGAILMIVGAVGLLVSIMFWSSWGGFGSSRRTTIEQDPTTTRRIVERDDVIR